MSYLKSKDFQELSVSENVIPRFCPFCSCPNLIFGLSETSISCPQCNRVTYLHSKPSVCAFITRDNQILLVSAGGNKWDLPGGFLLYGEAPTAGLEREVREELGVGIVIEALLGILVDTYGKNREPTLNIYYVVTLSSESLSPSAEIKQCRWFNINRLPELKYKSTEQIINKHSQVMKVNP